jgi:glycosyltransferase involved in cell wall biosynthesis
MMHTNFSSDAGRVPLSVTAVEPSGRLYGSEYCLLDIIHGIDRRCLSWTVITPHGRGFSNLLIEQGITCHNAIPDDLHHRTRLQKLAVYARLLWEVRRQRPHLLYINQAGMLKAGNAICRMLGIPGVCQVQTLEDALWISRSGVGAGNMQAFICNSDFIAERTRVPDERKCVLYQGISLAPVPVPRIHAATDPPTLGIIGRISESKGHYLTLQAVRLLRQRGIQVRIRVIGDGLTPEDTQRFMTAVNVAGLADTFDFRGYCRDLRTEFSQMRLLLIPSLAEPLGRVLYDAAHFGVPIIAADSGGLGEICRLYGVGVSFPAGNAEALASRIEASLNNLPEITSEFRARSARMVASLKMSSYLDAVQSILLRAADRQPVSIRWKGDLIPESSAETGSASAR